MTKEMAGEDGYTRVESAAPWAPPVEIPVLGPKSENKFEAIPLDITSEEDLAKAVKYHSNPEAPKNDSISDPIMAAQGVEIIDLPKTGDEEVDTLTEAGVRIASELTVNASKLSEEELAYHQGLLENVKGGLAFAKNETEKFVHKTAARTALAGSAILVAATACNAQVPPTITPTVDTNPAITQTVEIGPTSTAEVRGEFAGRVILGAKIGNISELDLSTSPDLALPTKIKEEAASEGLVAIENSEVFMYSMKGERGDAPFSIIGKKNDSGLVEKAWIVFGTEKITTENAQVDALSVPDLDGSFKFMELRVVDGTDGTKYIGTDAPDGSIRVLFAVNMTKGDVFFLPPYPDAGGAQANLTESAKKGFFDLSGNVELTETPTIIEEHDLDPNYTETVSEIFMGVKIDGEIITDRSLISAEKVTLPGQTYAEYVARTFFKTWWSKRPDAHRAGVANETDFKDFMSLWAKAQKSGVEEDWQKIDIPDIYANDLSDSNGYKQQKYTLRPMYGGVAPNGIRVLEKFTTVFVDTDGTKNMTPIVTGEMSFGSNFDNNTLYVYIGSHYQGGLINPPATFSDLMSNATQWLRGNTGQQIRIHFSIDKQLENLLVSKIRIQ
jgi:hypothetical protein